MLTSSISLQESNVKIYSPQEWKKILEIDDKKGTPYLELVNSIRYGIPDEL